MRAPLRLLEVDERWRSNQICNLCYQVMARINIEKFYQDPNEKLVTATNTYDDSAREVNLSKNQEIGQLSDLRIEINAAGVVDSGQGHLSVSRNQFHHVTPSRRGTVLLHQFNTFWHSKIIALSFYSKTLFFNDFFMKVLVHSRFCVFGSVITLLRALYSLLFCLFIFLNLAVFFFFFFLIIDRWKCISFNGLIRENSLVHCLYTAVNVVLFTYIQVQRFMIKAKSHLDTSFEKSQSVMDGT